MVELSEPIKFCAVIRRPPIGERDSLEVLRFSLGLVLLGSHVVEIHEILEGDGVFHALENLPEKVLNRDTSRISVVDSMDFDAQVYVVEEDLAARGLSKEDLVEGINVIQTQQVAELISQAKTTHFL